MWKRDTTRSPFEERGSVPGQGPTAGEVSVVIVGGFPSSEDVSASEPFSGRQGKFLNWGLGNAELYRPRLWLTNVLSTNPPAGDVSHPNVEAAIEAERDSFREEVEYLCRERAAKIFLLMGTMAMNAFGLYGDVSKYRGSVYVFDTVRWQETTAVDENTIFLLPTYHPSYLVRNKWTKSGGGKADLTAVWLDDLSKAKKIAKEGWTPPQERFNLTPTFEDVRRYVEERIAAQDLIAVDIETTGFEPEDGSIVCVGLAHTSEDAIVVPFLGERGAHYWPLDVGRNVQELLSRLFEEGGGLLLQNALFDVPYLRAKGYRIPPGAVKHDTLLLHHAVSPELPHKLGFIVSQYGTTPYWKDEFQNRDTTIVKMNQETLRRYNARDCVVLHQVLPGLLEDLDEIGAREVYENESLALIEPILEMQSTGVVFDSRRRNETKKKIERELQETETELRTRGRLPEDFNLGSDDDIRLFLFNEAGTKYDKGEEYETKKEGSKVRRELEALYNVRHHTTPLYLPTGFKGRRTDSGKIAINKQGRLSYQRHLQNRLAEIARFRKPSSKHVREKEEIEATLEWLKLYNTYAELKKTLSTYMEFPTKDDGRIHTKFHIHGTATGRLSSRSPNLQNFPKRKGKEIRSFLVAPPEHVILAADYSNLEVKVLAYETQDPSLIEVLDSGKNMHDVNTRILFHLEPEDEMWKASRAASKIFMFGSLAYGGGDREIYEKVILDVPDLRLTFREFVAAKERYMAAHPVYVAWRESILAKVRNDRQVKNAFGRVRTFYGNARDIGKEALNFPIQSAAASIINRATVAIHRRLRKEDYRTRLQAQIHDELRFEVPREELHDVAALVREEMTRPVLFHGKERHFEVEMEVGEDWAYLEEYTESEKNAC